MEKPETLIRAVIAQEREQLLHPIDRISEVLFGLIMAVTIVGSISIATAGHEDLRSITIAALGCNLAAKQGGRSDFFIVGVDGSPDAVAALKSKDGVFAATAAQDPYAMAQKAVEVGYDIMQGKKPEKDLILIPVKLITRENVDEYTGWTR